MDEGWYVGRIKEVPGVFSQGASLQKLEENIRDAYQLMMEEEEQVLSRAGAQTKEIGVEGHQPLRNCSRTKLREISHELAGLYYGRPECLPWEGMRQRDTNHGVGCA